MIAFSLGIIDENEAPVAVNLNNVVADVDDGLGRGALVGAVASLKRHLG